MHPTLSMQTYTYPRASRRLAANQPTSPKDLREVLFLGRLAGEATVSPSSADITTGSSLERFTGGSSKFIATIENSNISYLTGVDQCFFWAKQTTVGTGTYDKTRPTTPTPKPKYSIALTPNPATRAVEATLLTPFGLKAEEPKSARFLILDQKGLLRQFVEAPGVKTMIDLSGLEPGGYNVVEQLTGASASLIVK